MFKVLIIAIVLKISLIFAQPSPYGFNVQFIGKNRYVSVEEEAQRNFCGSFWCTNDAEILFTRSSQYKESDPCIDFKNFSVGTSLDVNVVNYRYPYRGFMSEVEFKYWEKLRRVLVEKVRSDDNRIFKIAKNTFQKCIKSKHALRHIDGHRELFNYLQSLGSSPYLSRHIAWNPSIFDIHNDYGFFWQKNSSALSMNLWNENQFSVAKLLDAEPADGLWLLFSYELRRCKYPIKSLCLRHSSTSKWNRIVMENLIEVLEYMNDNFIAGLYGKIELKEKMFKPAIESFKRLAVVKENVERDFGEEEVSVMKIKDLQELTKEYNVDWLKIINGQLLNRSHVDENEEILVEDVKFLKKIVSSVFNAEKRLVADYFTLSYLFLYQFLFIFHFDEEFVIVTAGTKKSPQRWESCLIFGMVNYLHPPLLLMYNRQHGNSSLNVMAEDFVRESVFEARRRFIDGTDLPLSKSVEILRKLMNLKVIIGFTENIFDANSLENYYGELKLNANESFVESWLKIKMHSVKARNEPFDSWRRNIEELSENVRINYNAEKNVLYIPHMFTIYPWYHPLRPRFFNTATMFVQVLVSINSGIKKYIKEKWNLQNFKTGLDDAVQIGYENYRKFLETNEDLQIGANFLTNPQLFWIARAVFHFSKYHKTIASDMNALQRLQIEYMHVEFKSKVGFQEAFNCSMSDGEWMKYYEYYWKYLKLKENGIGDNVV